MKYRASFRFYLAICGVVGFSWVLGFLLGRRRRAPTVEMSSEQLRNLYYQRKTLLLKKSFEPKPIWKLISPFFKHPTVLLVLAGLISSWLLPMIIDSSARNEKRRD